MPKPRVSARARQAVIDRAHECCEYCLTQVRFAPDPFSIEHIVPRSGGGTNDADNLALSCQGCNNRKHVSVTALDPVSGEEVPLYHPRLHHWREHFAWNEDASLLVGLTPTGRATIEKLQLNREGVVNLRQILHTIGRHPPVQSES